MLADIPFEVFTGGVIAIKAKLDTASRPLLFILDTGTAGISLDSATCLEMGLTPRETDTVITGIAGRKKVPFVFGLDLWLNNFRSSNLNFYVNDYTALSSIYGEKIDGILGYAFFKRFIISVNFDTSRISIFAPGKYRYGPGTVLHPAFSYLPIQRVAVKDERKVEFPFFMDSGAGLCMLLSERFHQDSNIISSGRKRVITQTEGLGGKKQVELTVLKQVKLLNYSFKNVPAYIYDDQMNVTEYPYTGGLLGNDLMRRFNMVYNYPAGEIHIVPNRHYRDDFDYSYTGMTIFEINGGIFLENVIDGSPAFRAGLKPGDEIISIDNNVLGKVMTYNALLQKAKEPLKLQIKRNDNFLTLVLYPDTILR